MANLSLEQRLILWRLRNGGRLVLEWKNGELWKAGIEKPGGRLSYLKGKKNVHAAYLLWADNWVEKKGPKHGVVIEKFTTAPKATSRIEEWRSGEEIMKAIRSEEINRRKLKKTKG